MASEPKVWKFSYSSKEAPLSLPAAQPPPSASKASSLPPDAGTPGTPAPAPLLRRSAHIDCAGSQQMCARASLLHLQLVCMTSRGEAWDQHSNTRVGFSTDAGRQAVLSFFECKGCHPARAVIDTRGSALPWLGVRQGCRRQTSRACPSAAFMLRSAGHEHAHSHLAVS